MAQENKICQICGEKGHSKFYCKKKPYKPIRRVSLKKANSIPIVASRKPLKAKGKKAIAWDKFVPVWKATYPPDFDGYWYCKIGGAALSDGKAEGGLRLNIGHDIARVRDSTKITDLENTYPECQKHNRLQGSRSLEEFLATNPSLICGNS
jgi:hypothetical protein